MGYRLSREAREDLLEIFEAGWVEFGFSQADQYRSELIRALGFLSDFPQVARERTEFVRPVRIHPFRSHVIIYVAEEAGVFIVRIRHGREDWSRNPSGL